MCFNQTRVGLSEINNMTRVALVTPWPAGQDNVPESGVGNYVKNILSAGSLNDDVSVICQQGAVQGNNLLGVDIIECWRPGPGAPFAIYKKLRKLEPDVVHVQHEFRIFGGIFATAATLIAIRLAMLRRSKLIITVHGVVTRNQMTPALLGVLGRPKLRAATRLIFVVYYRLLALISHEIITLHEILQLSLLQEYAVESRVIHHGLSMMSVDEQIQNRIDAEQPKVLMFGFLSTYKLPEVVLDLAESDLLPEAHFLIGIGKNPRITGKSYNLRYQSLSQRAQSLGKRGTWLGYLGEEELEYVLTQASVLVLPYSECIGASGVASRAIAHMPVCYSTALQPLFGPGPLMFELNAKSLSIAIQNSWSVGVGHSNSEFMKSWTMILEETTKLWRESVSH